MFLGFCRFESIFLFFTILKIYLEGIILNAKLRFFCKPFHEDSFYDIHEDSRLTTCEFVSWVNVCNNSIIVFLSFYQFKITFYFELSTLRLRQTRWNDRDLTHQRNFRRHFSVSNIKDVVEGFPGVVFVFFLFFFMAKG